MIPDCSVGLGELVERYNDTQPPNVLSLALHIFKDEDDMYEDVWSVKFTELTNADQGTLKNAPCAVRPS